MNPIETTTIFKPPSQSFLLIHTKPKDAPPHVVVSIQQAFEENIFGGIEARTDEFLWLTRYLSDYMGPMILCGVDQLGAALDKFGTQINEYLIPISQLTKDQILASIELVESRRVYCLLLEHQDTGAPETDVQYRDVKL